MIFKPAILVSRFLISLSNTGVDKTVVDVRVRSFGFKKSRRYTCGRWTQIFECHKHVTALFQNLLYLFVSGITKRTFNGECWKWYRCCNKPKG